ncbi:hypothetical protein [Pseudooceanicola sp.]|uniref:hypothetical protein n=1 Tax=Pseudooceanicola sp. TaxID=1914328 RepID=UPI0026364F4F|nr:hypothetical protein [Pseudooceanicola sp.]MDF1856267.1 hypothetical protein [Pseudooceanicola sp.]
MFGFIPVLVIGFVVLSIVYLALSVWSRQVRRGKLRQRWHDEGGKGDLETYIHQGLEDYDDSFRRKLILLVYIVPLVAVGGIIYVVNYQ